MWTGLTLIINLSQNLTIYVASGFNRVTDGQQLPTYYTLKSTVSGI